MHLFCSCFCFCFHSHFYLQHSCILHCCSYSCSYPQVLEALDVECGQQPGSDHAGGHTTAVAAGNPPPAEGRAYVPTPLSVQVRGMRRPSDDEESVQRNVSEAFDNFMRRLARLYEGVAAEKAPKEFDACIRFWFTACGLPDDARAGLQKLRVWRNASLHHDRQRWAREGPRSADEASQHLLGLECSIATLEEAAGIAAASSRG